MIRRLIQTFPTYDLASEFKATLDEGVYQIRRKQKGFEVVRRVSGVSKWSDIKAAKGAYTKKRKGKRHVTFE